MAETGKAKARNRPQGTTIDEATRLAAWDELVRLKIRGASRRQCAETLGFDYSTIGRWQRDLRFQVLLRRTRALVFTKTEAAGDEAAREVYASTKEKIKRYAEEALDKVATLMACAESEGLQAKCAMDLMDRSPETSKTQKVTHTGGVLVFTPENLRLAFETARELQVDRVIGQHMEPLPIDERMDALPEDEG